MTSNDKRVLGCFSHHKCASTWFEDIYRAICSELGLKFETVYSEQDFDGDLPAFIRSRGIDFICYSNADYAQTVGSRTLSGSMSCGTLGISLFRRISLTSRHIQQMPGRN